MAPFNFEIDQVPNAKAIVSFSKNGSIHQQLVNYSIHPKL